MNRRGVRYPALTSLLDVLFLLLFAALVQSAALVEDAGARAPAEPVLQAGADAGPADAGPSDASVPGLVSEAAVVDRAVAQLERQLHQKTPVIVQLDDDTVTSVERIGPSGKRERIPFLVDLLQPSVDPDVVIEYRGFADPERRICNLVPQAFPDLVMQDTLIIISPAAAIESLPVALVKGMMADVRHCASRGATAVIEPQRSSGPGEVTP